MISTSAANCTQELVEIIIFKIRLILFPHTLLWGILNNARNPWEAFQGFILYVHVEDDIISPRYDRIFDIHFRLRDTSDFVPHILIWGILNNAGSPIKPNQHLLTSKWC